MAEAAPHELLVSVVSADRELWTGAAKQVVARTTIGQIGLLAGHEPVLGILASGEVRITTTDGSVVTAQAEDGFLSMQNDVVTIVAGAAELT
ncbi:MAG TPA: F0F1 ATP synthase subunit epsilon [Pseudolysinimonas sp.]|jgi:F-type H+-transporting ATPase subunit epsilon|nr:synthase subunit epsilon [Schumannella sp.]HEV7741571.1 F0F1 ATP synthase subunit epsilon [Pseudolysinimonas sp.]